MDFIPADRPVEPVGMGSDAGQPLVACQHRLDPQMAKPVRGTSRPLDPLRVVKPCPQHLIPATQPHHHAAAPQMRGKVDVPALRAEKGQIGYGGFRARKQHHVGIQRDHVACFDQNDIHIRLAGKRIKIVEIGDPAQHRHGNPHRRAVSRLAGLALDIENILGGKEARRREPGKDADSRPSSGALDNLYTLGEQCGIAAELVDQEPLDQRAVGGLEDGVGADEAGDDAAAVDVTHHHHRHIRGDGKPHIGDVAGAKIDLGRASRTLDDDQIDIAPDDLETVQNTGQQIGLVGAVFAGPHAAEPLALDDNLRSRLAFRLQQDRIHMDRCWGAAAACLHRLRAAYLAAILGHGGVV